MPLKSNFLVFSKLLHFYILKISKYKMSLIYFLSTCCALCCIGHLFVVLRGLCQLCQPVLDVLSSLADETVTLSAVLERLNPHLAQIKVLHKVFCTGVAEVPAETPNVVRASHLLNTLYKAIIEYDSVGEASEQAVSLSQLSNFTPQILTRKK